MMADLNYLSTLDDDEADSLVRGMVGRHGIEKVAPLLDWLLIWDPRDAFPADRVDPVLRQEAEVFLQRIDVLDGAFAPEQVDWTRVQRAQALYQKYPMSGLMVLGCASLPACYAHPDIALLLTGSGRLAVQVTRRLKETIDFLQVVMTPGSLQNGGLGVKWIRKVRLMHALMRALVRHKASPSRGPAGAGLSSFLMSLDWEARPKGTKPQGTKPIDQVELGYVLLTFSWLLVRGFDKLSINLEETQQDDHIYTWAVIGHGLGIAGEALRPRKASKARELFDEIRAAREEGTEQGRLLTAALVVYIVFAQQEQVKTLPAWMQSLYRSVQPFADTCFQGLARTLIRSLAGKETAQRLWVPRAPLLHWLVGLVLRAGMTLLDMRRPDEKGLPRVLGASLKELAPRR
jgi:hypothetical protein